MAKPASAYPGPVASDERRSGMVFTGILVLVLLAVVFPEMASQGLKGILWTGAGLLMILMPPVVRIPRLWVLLAAGFVLFSLAGFLPREWFHASPWRSDLEKLGLATGAQAFVQPRLAAENMAGFAATALTALFLLGHRIGSLRHQRLALGFTLGVGVWATAALVMHEPGKLFGFFPNRNHSATLLVMGTFTGLGSLAHAIRRKDFWKIPLAAVPVGICLYALHAVSESRAGVVLIFVGFVLWILLTGFRHLQGNVGKAILLILIAASGTFFIVDSTAKKRLTATVEQLAPLERGSAVTPENPFAVDTAMRLEAPMDGRITIFQGALEMVRQESWAGVGPGQFVYVFSQYRGSFNIPNDGKCLHPESDWLMMLAETGWPATLCLAAGVIAVFYSAVRQVRRGRSRLLRTGCVVAALVLCIHGIFDVPGHRVGLAWAAALLLASSLRSHESGESDVGPAPSRLSGHCWRGFGGVLALAGIFLIHAQWTQRTILPSEQVRQWMGEAKKLYDQDQAAYALARAEGRDYQPTPSEDPLEVAIVRVKQAIDETPLDPYFHYVLGSLALHYDDKRAIAERSFAIQRRLDPARVSLAMEQARSWSQQDTQEVLVLWKEALRRASIEESRLPGSSFGVAITYQRAVYDAGKDEALIIAALELAGNDPSLWLIWASSAPVNLLDREMPRMLADPVGAELRETLFQTWEKRGSKDAAVKFATSHPELGLSHP